MLSKFLLIKKYKRSLLSLSSILLITINLISLYFIFEITPRSNDECLWVGKRDTAGLYFSLVKENGVTWNAGIRDGDQLLAINGRELSSAAIATLVFDRLEKGEKAIYTVSRNGEVFETEVEVKKLIQFVGLGAVLLSFVWVLVGYLVVMAKHDGDLQILFFKIGVGSTLGSLVYLYFGNVVLNPIFNAGWIIVIIDVLASIGLSFMPFWLIKFFWVFPNKFKIVENKFVNIFLSFTPYLILTITIITKIIYVYPYNVIGFVNVRTVILLGLVSFVSAVIGLISLFLNYIKIKNVKDKNPILIILVGYTIGIIAIFYTSTFANVFAESVFNSPEYYMPILLTAVIPITFGFSIFRYSLLDVSDVLKNAITYGVATISLAGIYFAIIYFIGQSVSLAIGTEYQGAIAGIVFIIFAVIFQSTKDKFQNILTKRFYPEQFASQKVLLKFSNDISSIVGLKNILETTKETFTDLLKINKFGIYLYNNENSKFKLQISEGFNEEDVEVSTDIDKIKAFLHQKEKLNRFQVIERDEFNIVFPSCVDDFIEEKIYTIIPLTIKSKIIGLVVFGLKYSGAQFAGKDLQLLVAAVNQVAIAIESARLYKSEARKDILERDLDNARRIQENLLPSKIPIIKNLDLSGIMIPAQHVAGDYYDFIKVSDTKLFVVTGDVSGKGLAASFYMTKLQTMIRLYCKEEECPKHVLTKLNKSIYDEIERNWFITISIALFNTETNELLFARAGHTPLMKFRNESVELIQPKGIGVALDKGEIFEKSLEEIKIKLEPNDIYLFYSDGVNEEMNYDKKLFGNNALSHELVINSTHRSEQIIKNIISSLSKFRGSKEPNDDVTLVAVKVK